MSPARLPKQAGLDPRRPRTLQAAQIMAYAAGAGISDRQGLITATAVALAESGGRTAVVSRTNDVGVWQINLAAHPQYQAARLKDPAENARAMFEISGGGRTWTPWVTYNSGAYRRHLAPARRAFTSGAYRTARDGNAAIPKATTGGGIDLPDVAGALDDLNPLDVVGDFFGLDDLAENAMVIALSTVFALAGLALVILGLLRMTGTSSRQAIGAAGTVATGGGTGAALAAATAL